MKTKLETKKVNLLLNNDNFLNNQNYILAKKNKIEIWFFLFISKILKFLTSYIFLLLIYFIFLVFYFINYDFKEFFKNLFFIIPIYISIFLIALNVIILPTFSIILNWTIKINNKFNKLILKIIFFYIYLPINFITGKEKKLPKESLFDDNHFFYIKDRKNLNWSLKFFFLVSYVLIFFLIPIFYFKKYILDLNIVIVFLFFSYILLIIYIFVKYFLVFLSKINDSYDLNILNIIIFIVFSPIIFLYFIFYKLKNNNQIKIYKINHKKYIFNWFKHINKNLIEAKNFRIVYVNKKK